MASMFKNQYKLVVGAGDKVQEVHFDFSMPDLLLEYKLIDILLLPVVTYIFSHIYCKWHIIFVYIFWAGGGSDMAGYRGDEACDSIVHQKSRVDVVSL